MTKLSIDYLILLVIGIWSFVIIWILGFGYWNLKIPESIG
jgi:hypothetical protein